jgi:predicted transporter
MFHFTLAYAIALEVCVLGVGITQAFLIKFSNRGTKNAFTLKPYYLLNLYLFARILIDSSSLSLYSNTLTFWD